MATRVYIKKCLSKNPALSFFPPEAEEFNELYLEVKEIVFNILGVKCLKR